MGQFRNKQSVDARQFNGTKESYDAIRSWVTDGGGIMEAWVGTRRTFVSLRTRVGDMVVDPGDWVMKGENGEFLPCKPDAFAANYEVAA